MKKTQTDQRIMVPIKKRTMHYAKPLEYNILSEKKIKFTEARAFDFLELEAFDGERAVREGHVQFLFDEYAAGRFLWHNVTLARAKLGQREYRINGQHTCWMRVNIKEPGLAPEVREIEYSVKDSDQLRALYSTFDRAAPRTAGHIASVLLLDSPAASGISQSYIRTLLAGFRMFKGTLWRLNTNTAELTSEIKQAHSELFNVVGQFCTQHYTEAGFVRRAAVIGAMFATFAKAVQKSIDFWTPTCSGIGLEEKTDPRFQLRKYLESHTHGTFRGKDYVSAEVLHRICIIAWNHWLAGTKVTKINSPSTDPARPVAKAN